jgi:TATA-binding protein-associated factor
MDINDMIRDDDIIQRGMGSENGQYIHGSVYHNTEGKQRVQQLVANMVPANFPRRLSARERNLLKRKAKESMKETLKGWGEDDEVDEPSSKRTKSIKPFVMDPPTGDKVHAAFIIVTFQDLMYVI